MTHSHTKGPWLISGNTLLHVTGAPANIHVATVDKVRPSDARLIAAAPELFDALETVQSAYTKDALALAHAIKHAIKVIKQTKGK